MAIFFVCVADMRADEDAPGVVVLNNPNFPAVKVELLEYSAPKRVVRVESYDGPKISLKPTNRVTDLAIRPKCGGYLYQWGVWFSRHKLVNNGKIGLRLQKITADTQVQVQVLEPVASWRGTTFRVGKALVAVSMSSDFKRGMRHWAEIGDKELATELARSVTEGRNTAGHWGLFTLESRWGVIVPSDVDTVHPAIREITEKDLAKHIRQALEVIKDNISATNGFTVREALEASKK